MHILSRPIISQLNSIDLTVLHSIDFGFYFGVARFRCQDLNFISGLIIAMQLINVISQSTTFDKHHLTVVTLVLVLHSDDLQTPCVLPIEFLTTKFTN